VAVSLLHVPVDLGDQSYSIEIGSGNLAQLPAVVQQLADVSHAIVISDSEVRPLYAESVSQSLEAAGLRVDLLEIAAGESSKAAETVAHLWNALLQAGADRFSVVVAVGGGVVGDLAGFVAASYARGIRFVQAPTTLLAQVDSSVGGKVGINLAGGKNMVGAFWQPAAVVIDTETLTSLPDRQFSAGLAEVVKYGVIMDPDFFSLLEQQAAAIWERDAETLRSVVAHCCQLKAEVVAEDERETSGRRAILNYGHTFCHAIEALSGYGTILHGEAVSIGMICASRLAASMGRIESAVTDRQLALLAQFQLPVQLPDLDVEEMIQLMRRDKKSQHGELRFVLPASLGQVELVEGVDLELVRSAIQESQAG
jgi:3-dehydroquinate synthase